MKYDTLTIPLKVTFNFYGTVALNADQVACEVVEITDTEITLHFTCEGMHLSVELDTKIICDVNFIAKLDTKLLFDAKTFGMQKHLTYHDLDELYNIRNIKIGYGGEAPHSTDITERTHLEEEIWEYLREHDKEPLIAYHVEL